MCFSLCHLHLLENTTLLCEIISCGWGDFHKVYIGPVFLIVHRGNFGKHLAHVRIDQTPPKTQMGEKVSPFAFGWNAVQDSGFDCQLFYNFLFILLFLCVGWNLVLPILNVPHPFKHTRIESPFPHVKHATLPQTNHEQHKRKYKTHDKWKKGQWEQNTSEVNSNTYTTKPVHSWKSRHLNMRDSLC